MYGKDDRRSNKFKRSEKHFERKSIRTKKDAEKPRNKPAEDRGRSDGSRRENRIMARKTLDIIEKQIYTTPDLKVVNLQFLLEKTETKTYTPEETPIDISNLEKKNSETEFVIRKCSTLAAIFREYKYLEPKNPDKLDLISSTDKISVLNFASARNPGGGFLKGSTAQEEGLMRCSSLYSEIVNSEMYAYNERDTKDFLYNDFIIYSKNVIVIRDEDDQLLNQPLIVDFITVPAVNTAKALQKKVSEEKIYAKMLDRMDRFLSLAVLNQVDVLILGAWGCGVFGGDYNIVSSQFMELLSNKYYGYFKRVIFALFSDEHYKIMGQFDFGVRFE